MEALEYTQHLLEGVLVSDGGILLFLLLLTLLGGGVEHHTAPLGAAGATLTFGPFDSLALVGGLFLYGDLFFRVALGVIGLVRVMFGLADEEVVVVVGSVQFEKGVVVHQVEEQVGLAVEEVLLGYSGLVLLLLVEHGEVDTRLLLYSELHSVHAVE